MLFLLLLLPWIGCAFSVNLTAWDQSNTVERWPNLAQRVRVQNITDIAGQPLLEAADDFVLPDLAFFRSLGAANGLVDCQSMTLQFQGIRLRSFSNPASVTLQMWRDDNGSPGALFYKRSWPWPSNDNAWLRDYLGLPWSYELTLQWNELGDDGLTRFNFRDASFLPPLRRVWLGVYCTVKQEYTTGMRINALYWVTQSNTSNATPLSASLYGGQANQPLQVRYVDPARVMQTSFQNWTTAALYEQFAGPVAPTGQLAWRLWFQCQVPPPPTPAPTQAPTTPAPTATPRPSAAPTPSTEAPTNASVQVDATGGGGGTSATSVALGVALPLTLVTALLGLCFLVRYMRHRRTAQRVAEGVQNKRRQTEAQRLQRRPLPAIHGAYSEIPLDELNTTRSSSTSQFLDRHYDDAIHTSSDHD